MGLKFTYVLMLIKKKKLKAEFQGKILLIDREEILRFAEDHKILLR